MYQENNKIFKCKEQKQKTIKNKGLKSINNQLIELEVEANNLGNKTSLINASTVDKNSQLN